MLKEAFFYKKLKSGEILCELCPHFCLIRDKDCGRCGVRINKEGKLYSLVYGRVAAMHIDPIEKKPIYHFYPGSRVFSFATQGCNLSCRYCQNYSISQLKPFYHVWGEEMTPEQIVKIAIKERCIGIAYTYTEPTIFYEFMLDCAKLAKKNGLKNVLVSNGFINLDPLKRLSRYIDAANIDIKSIENKFYEENCNGRVKPVLECVKFLHKTGIWTEITNLIIPGQNDKKENIEKLVKWILENLGKEVPLHFSAFYPCFEMMNISKTPEKTLKMAKRIAETRGIDYVYIGNVNLDNNTYCSNCKKILIKRKNYNVEKINIEKKKCLYCKEKISGIF